MRNGLDQEPQARKWFELTTGYTVEEVGFCTTDDGRFGVSPDGLILGDQGSYIGTLELKVPRLDTHMAYLLDGELPADYRPQCHFALFVSELPLLKFMSYSAPAPEMLLTVERDEYTQKVEAAALEFQAKYEAAWQRVQQMGGRA